MKNEFSAGGFIVGLLALAVLFISLTNDPQALNHQAQRWAVFVPSAVWVLTGARGGNYRRMLAGLISAVVWNPFQIVYIPASIWLGVVFAFMALFIAVLRYEWRSLERNDSKL